LQIADDLYIGPKTKDEVERSFIYFNHSCEPNMGVQGQIVFVAIRDIRPGEEITCDYATIETCDYVISCNCGSKSCRKMITGHDYRNKILQEKVDKDKHL